MDERIRELIDYIKMLIDLMSMMRYSKVTVR